MARFKSSKTKRSSMKQGEKATHNAHRSMSPQNLRIEKRNSINTNDVLYYVEMS